MYPIILENNLLPLIDINICSRSIANHDTIKIADSVIRKVY